MNKANTEPTGDTIRIRRPPKVYTDTLGRTIWMSGIEPCVLELETTPATDPYNRNPVAEATSLSR